MTVTDRMRTNVSALPLLALFGAGLALGLSPIFMRLSEVGPLVSGFYRLALAAPFFWLIGTLGPPAQRADAQISFRDRLLILLAGLTFAADIACWHMGIAYTSVADATLLANMAPLFVAGAAWLLFGQAISPAFAVGLALALFGAATLAIQKNTGLEPPDRFLGDVLSGAAAACFAVYMLLVAELRKRHSTSRVVFGATAISAIALLPIALLTGPSMLPTALTGWAALIGLALVSHVGGQGLFAYALAHLPAGLSAMSQFLATGVAAVAAWALLGESLTWMKVVSGLAILAGIWICQRASRA